MTTPAQQRRRYSRRRSWRSRWRIAWPRRRGGRRVGIRPGGARTRRATVTRSRRDETHHGPGRCGRDGLKFTCRVVHHLRAGRQRALEADGHRSQQDKVNLGHREILPSGGERPQLSRPFAQNNGSLDGLRNTSTVVVAAGIHWVTGTHSIVVVLVTITLRAGACRPTTGKTDTTLKSDLFCHRCVICRPSPVVVYKIAAANS